MRIYTLPVNSRLQPKSQPFAYPPHNDDYGVEQDFLEFILKHKELTTNIEKEADWYYLPVFWTRWYLNNNYGKKNKAIIQKYVTEAINNRSKIFTICQYDDGPMVDLGKTRVFYSSRKEEHGYDIPLISANLPSPFLRSPKKYLGSFVGRLSTHRIRGLMNTFLMNDDNFQILDGEFGKKKYIKTMISSYVSLCPRGYGGNSFRFYESMQLGVVPMLIGDKDTRPFKKNIDWDHCSFYCKHPKDIISKIQSYSLSQLIEMGKQAKKTWRDNLAYKKWCRLLMDDLV